MAGDLPDLSIVILNFNVKDLLIKCLESVFKDEASKRWQVIVVDNASTDGSVEAVKQTYSHIRSGNVVEIVENESKASFGSQNNGNFVVIQNKENIGFAAGNNSAIKKIKAPVVLFLNPDTVIVDDAISKSLKFLLSNPDIGALTCKIELPSGKLDYSCHRGFPTPWNSFCYFIGLSKLFPKWKLFSGYTASYLDTRTTHEIDCLTGAFLMVRKIAGDQINWWDQTYFWNGEDIEFCYSLKEKGWKIYFYPEAKIIHYKGSSSGKQRSKAISHGISAMRIFYKKHYYKNYPPIFRELILWGIKTLEHYRKVKLWIYQ